MSFCQARNASIQSSNVAIFFMISPETRIISGLCRLEIDWEGLVVAFENRSQKITHFFDRADRRRRPGPRDATPRATPSSPRIRATRRCRATQGERSRGDLEDFAAHCEDEACRRELRRPRSPPSDRPSAFRAALLRHPKEEAHFFQFKERRARERAVEWLKEQGIVKASSDAQTLQAQDPEPFAARGSRAAPRGSATTPRTRPRRRSAPRSIR